MTGTSTGVGHATVEARYESAQARYFAIAGELMRGGDVRTSVRTGIAAFLGMLAGAVANFAIGVTMVGLFVWWSAAR